MNNDLISKKEVIETIDKFGYVNCYNGKDYEANRRVNQIRQKIIEMKCFFCNFKLQNNNYKQVKELRAYSNVSLYAREGKVRELLSQAADTIEALSANASIGINEATKCDCCGGYAPFIGWIMRIMLLLTAKEKCW